MSTPESDVPQPTPEDVLSSLTPECRQMLAELLIAKPEAVPTLLSLMPVGSRTALEVLGVVTATDTELSPLYAMTDFGQQVAFIAATTPPDEEQV